MTLVQLLKNTVVFFFNLPQPPKDIILSPSSMGGSMPKLFISQTVPHAYGLMLESQDEAEKEKEGSQREDNLGFKTGCLEVWKKEKPMG